MWSKEIRAPMQDVIVHTGVKTAKVIPVIQIVTTGGLGTAEDPKREVLEYRDMDGKILFVTDAWSEETINYVPKKS